ncbi:type IV pilus biogenesis protein PilP [Pseudomonas amygdali]|uniref:type IV pilus biogenesis protein PilP n=1 Tax=Pseudomonas amygdali TaxID=47877 RepID=UPI0009BB24DD
MANPFSLFRKRAPRAQLPSDGKVQILTYHGRSFVTGLLWHPLGSLTGYMKEARQFGRAQQMDIVAIRHTESVIQAGFVSQNDGAVKGMYSLAAALAGQLGASWLAAWKIEDAEDRYALVAVYRGAVIPGADLVGSSEEIKKKVAQQLSRSMSFDKIFLPPEFARGGERFDPDTFLQPSNLKREYKLTPLAFGLSRQELLKAAVIGSLVVAGLIGWQQWNEHKLQLARQAQEAAEAARQAELDALNQRTNSPVVIEALVHPWVKQPSVPVFLEGCNGAIDQLLPAIEGWLFVSAKCDGTLMSASNTAPQLPVVKTVFRTNNALYATLLYGSGFEVDASVGNAELPGGFKVISVSLDSVVLGHDGRRYPLGFSTKAPIGSVDAPQMSLQTLKPMTPSQPSAMSPLSSMSQELQR